MADNGIRVRTAAGLEITEVNETTNWSLWNLIQMFLQNLSSFFLSILFVDQKLTSIIVGAEVHPFEEYQERKISSFMYLVQNVSWSCSPWLALCWLNATSFYWEAHQVLGIFYKSCFSVPQVNNEVNIMILFYTITLMYS